MYEIYMTDCLQAITNMYNKAHGGNGETVNKRFYDILNPPKENNETPEQIIERIKKKLGN